MLKIHAFQLGSIFSAILAVKLGCQLPVMKDHHTAIFVDVEGEPQVAVVS
ncbi:MAG: hypothetical protein P1V33_14280 [Pseudohongiella nitratireducens]|nr:hypothetical protein [Pseudohongiella nitratireducens]MDF1624621.1 hypothetical protein [Pseudohongiella nitratireducens]